MKELTLYDLGLARKKEKVEIKALTEDQWKLVNKLVEIEDISQYSSSWFGNYKKKLSQIRLNELPINEKKFVAPIKERFRFEYADRKERQRLKRLRVRRARKDKEKAHISFLRNKGILPSKDDLEIERRKKKREKEISDAKKNRVLPLF